MDMKKIVLAGILFCTFSVHAIAVNSDQKLNDIEIAQEKINALKVERANIENKLTPVRDEMRVTIKKRMTLKEKIISLEHGVLGVTYYKTLIEKKENDVKNLTLLAAEYSIYPVLNKINLDIDKAKIELIKAEIKAKKTPKVPLEIVKAMIKHDNAVAKFNEARVKAIEAQIKEKEAYIERIEVEVEICKKVEERIKNTNNFDRIFYNANIRIEFAELGYKQDMLELKFKQAQSKRVHVQTKKVQAHVELCKSEQKFYKTILEFGKVIDEKNLEKFLNHD